MSDFTNHYDNSEHVPTDTRKDVFLLSSTGTADEINAMKDYYQYLELRANIENTDKKIKVGKEQVKLSDLMPAQSEFEQLRLKVIHLLNKLGPDDSLYQQLASDFGTTSPFELASKYANYVLVRSRADRLFGVLTGKIGEASVYDSLIDDDDSTKVKAKEALSKGTFTPSVIARPF